MKKMSDKKFLVILWQNEEQLWHFLKHNNIRAALMSFM